MIKGKPGEPGKPGKDLRVCKSVTNSLSYRQISFINQIFIMVFSIILVISNVFFICRC